MCLSHLILLFDSLLSEMLHLLISFFVYMTKLWLLHQALIWCKFSLLKLNTMCMSRVRHLRCYFHTDFHQTTGAYIIIRNCKANHITELQFIVRNYSFSYHLVSYWNVLQIKVIEQKEISILQNLPISIFEPILVK